MNESTVVGFKVSFKSAVLVVVVLKREVEEKDLGPKPRNKTGRWGVFSSLYREFLLNKITFFSTDLSKHVIIVEITFLFLYFQKVPR